MPQGSSQAPVPGPARPHRVVVDENSNPFELGCATVAFELRGPDLGRALYEFALCSPAPGTPMRTASSRSPVWPDSTRPTPRTP